MAIEEERLGETTAETGAEKADSQEPVEADVAAEMREAESTIGREVGREERSAEGDIAGAQALGGEEEATQMAESHLGEVQAAVAEANAQLLIYTSPEGAVHSQMRASGNRRINIHMGEMGSKGGRMIEIMQLNGRRIRIPATEGPAAFSGPIDGELTQHEPQAVDQEEFEAMRKEWDDMEGGFTDGKEEQRSPESGNPNLFMVDNLAYVLPSGSHRMEVGNVVSEVKGSGNVSMHIQGNASGLNIDWGPKGLFVGGREIKMPTRDQAPDIAAPNGSRIRVQKNEGGAEAVVTGPDGRVFAREFHPRVPMSEGREPAQSPEPIVFSPDQKFGKEPSPEQVAEIARLAAEMNTYTPEDPVRKIEITPDLSETASSESEIREAEVLGVPEEALNTPANLAPLAWEKLAERYSRTLEVEAVQESETTPRTPLQRGRIEAYRQFRQKMDAELERITALQGGEKERGINTDSLLEIFLPDEKRRKGFLSMIGKIADKLLSRTFFGIMSRMMRYSGEEIASKMAKIEDEAKRGKIQEMAQLVANLYLLGEQHPASLEKLNKFRGPDR